MQLFTQTSAASFLPAPQPAHDHDWPDPCVLPVPGGYLLYATNAPGRNVPVMFSPDLTHFTPLGDALPVLPAWAEPGLTWAPEVCELGGRFLLYFTARLRGSGRQVIGVAVAGQPQGPFVATGQPLITMLAQGGAIDAGSLHTRDGRHLLYWKNDGNAADLPTHLWGAALSADGLRLQHAPTALLGATEPWEHRLVEAPQVIEDGGNFHLLYSCADFGDETYAVGHACGNSPLGPFKKSAAAPLLASYGGMAGPGHSCAFRDHAGQWQLAYHAWAAGRCGYPHGRRALHVSPLHLHGSQAQVALPEVWAQASD